MHTTMQLLQLRTVLRIRNTCKCTLYARQASTRVNKCVYYPLDILFLSIPSLSGRGISRDIRWLLFHVAWADADVNS
jgi:hypothetical protein